VNAKAEHITKSVVARCDAAEDVIALPRKLGDIFLIGFIPSNHLECSASQREDGKRRGFFSDSLD
jgi:hypothetical protein